MVEKWRSSGGGLIGFGVSVGAKLAYCQSLVELFNQRFIRKSVIIFSTLVKVRVYG
nr:MAG TPA: hypothetical protein [Caudoviricetes sp.]